MINSPVVMKKENVMFAVTGLLAGTIIGFIFANSINKGAVPQTAVPTTASAVPPGSAGPLSGNEQMPPNHPPINGDTSGQQQPAGGAAMIAQVSAAIEKAKQEPQNYESQMTAADLYYQIQRFPDAAKFYEAATKLKPNDAEAFIKTGNAYFDAEKFTDAEPWYIKALELDPKNIAVRTDLGLTYYLREPHDFDAAIREYEKSLAINPNHEVTLQNLGLAYRDKGDKVNLLKTITKLKSINPKNAALPQLEGTTSAS